MIPRNPQGYPESVSGANAHLLACTLAARDGKPDGRTRRRGEHSMLMETQTRDRVVGPFEARAIAELAAHRENVACRGGKKLSPKEKDAILAKVHADIEARRTAGLSESSSRRRARRDKRETW